MFVDVVHEFFENFNIKNKNIYIARYILKTIIVKYLNINEIEFLKNCDCDRDWFEINYFCKREIIDKSNVDDNISKVFVFVCFFVFFVIVIVIVLIVVIVVIVVVVVIIIVFVVFIDLTFLLFAQFFIFVNLNFEIVEILVCLIF